MAHKQLPDSPVVYTQADVALETTQREGSMTVCIQMLRVAWRSPFIKQVNCELCQYLPSLLHGSLLSLRSSKSFQNSAGAEERWGLGTRFCMQATYGSSSQPEVRPLNPWGSCLDFLSLWVALCPAYCGGVRGPSWHSVCFSKGGSSHRMGTWKCLLSSCLDNPSNKPQVRSMPRDRVTLT